MIYYRSLKRVSRAVRHRIERMADELCHRYAWASACEPVAFHSPRQPLRAAELSGRSVVGRGRPRPLQPSKAKSAAPSLPTADVPQLISVLCELSAAWSLTWELRWDPQGEPVARIDDGRCDAGVFDRVLSEVNAERAAEWRTAAQEDMNMSVGEGQGGEEGDEPQSLPMKQRGPVGEGGMRLADLLVDTWTGADLSKVSIQIAELEQQSTPQRAPLIESEDPEDDDPFGPATLPFPAR